VREEQNIAEWCFNRLESADDYFLPLDFMWKEYVRESGQTALTFEQFKGTLLDDKRFFITAGERKPPNGMEREVLDQLGLPGASLVGLADRKPSQKELDNAIRAKAVQMRYALQKAWEARPSNDEAVEERLLFLMEQAENLCEALGVDNPDAK